MGGGEPAERDLLQGFKVVQSGDGGVDTCVVVVERQAAGAGVWTACIPNLEDLGQAGADIPFGVDCLPLLERDRGNMTGFGEEDCDHLFKVKCFPIF